MATFAHPGSHRSLTREQRGWLSRYQRLRAASRRLNDRLLDRLPRGALARCAKELGLVRDRTVVLENLDVEGAMLMDYALHDHRPTADRRSIAERFCSSAFDREAASLDHDEAAARRYRATARFALLQICDAVVGLGVHVYDVLRGGEPFLLADVALSRTGGPGVAFATRLVDPTSAPLSTIWLAMFCGSASALRNHPRRSAGGMTLAGRKARAPHDATLLTIRAVLQLSVTQPPARPCALAR